ncbi:NAD(P)-binding domain-containing protein [Staphylococcus debuckii]|uniref:NAD(P)-binding domain-containing protein n=1 Tax=Staphylococcus debuckii TaxID=2044912 RepID=UPI000F436A18|nr:FAD/NAD(P)-binding protein [Staphylococcus debuckii]AYU54725.1 pyridine nucleotide-disulfide oxidoreductase [Staphylococcus debuckii]
MSWTIIGGGIHAVTIAIKLRASGLPAEDLTIIDPHESLCEQFDDYSCRIGMPFLRSPHVHHVHPDPFHLKQFAKSNQYTGATYGRYQRPQRDMFMDHIHELLHDYDLNKRHIKAFASDISKENNQWIVTLDSGEQVVSQHVVLASGCNHRPYIPPMYQAQPDVQHIFESKTIQYEGTSHVVGSGISAAHLTLKLINKTDTDTVHLWLKKPIEIHDFDADPGWLGPKNMVHFRELESSEEKMNVILNERHKGSMPKELYLRLKKHKQQGELVIHQNEIQAIKNHEIITEEKNYKYDRILLATGFQNTIMRQPLVRKLINTYDAPLAKTGYPSISEDLEWLPGLFVSGGLADLELGPFARNVMGGRESASRIANAFVNKVEKVS